MKAEFIYTFEKSDQQFDVIPIQENDLTDKQTFFELAVSKLSESEKMELCKISCCIYDVTIPEPPQWYIECNGKLWIENGVLSD